MNNNYMMPNYPAQQNDKYCKKLKYIGDIIS